VLDRSEWTAWLDPQTAEADLLKPSPPGALKVEKVTRRPKQNIDAA
jgi:putative SOS response-associated peptidase YedK